MSQVPRASMRRAPFGTGQLGRGPAQVMRPSRTMTAASVTGAAPVPSRSVAPVMAMEDCTRGAPTHARVSARASAEVAIGLGTDGCR